MLVPVKFIIESTQAKEIESLRFYLAARNQGMGNAGYFKDIPGFTWSQKIKLTKKLVQKGWLIPAVACRKLFRIKSVYKLEAFPVLASCDPEVLKSKKKFRGWILAVAESYVARNNFRINKGWKKEFDYRSNTFVRKHSVLGVSKFSDGSYMTQIANSFLAALLGVSTRTLSRWRHHSANVYKITKKFAVSQYAFNEGKFFFSKRSKMFVQYVQEVKTRIFIYYAGEKHEKKLFPSIV
jgi:hypothetical protein